MKKMSKSNTVSRSGSGLSSPLLILGACLLAISLSMVLVLGGVQRLALILAGAMVLILSLFDPIYPISIYFLHSALQEFLGFPDYISTITGPALICCAFVGILRERYARRTSIRTYLVPLDVGVICFSLLVVVSSLLGGGAYYDTYNLLRQQIAVLGIYWAIRLGVNSDRQLRILIWVLVSGNILFAGHDLWNHYTTTGSLLYLSSPYEFASLRLRSTLTNADPNYFAWSLLMPIALVATVGVQGRNWFLRVLSIPLLAVMLLAVALSFSRGMWLAVFSIVLVLAWQSRKQLGAAGLIPIVVGAILIGYLGPDLFLKRVQGFGSLDPFGDRLKYASLAISIWQDNWLIGIGYGRFRFYNPTGQVAHNTFLGNFAELGTFGGLLFIACVLGACWYYIQAHKQATAANSKELGLMIQGFQVGFIAQLVGMASFTADFGADVIFCFVTAVATLMIARRLQDRVNTPEKSK